MKIPKTIYLDHTATTYLDSEVKKAMEPYWSEIFGNPSALYSIGREAKTVLNSCRQKIASIINAKESEIIFTAGGTESDNLAIFGVARANKSRGKHIIISNIEHHAVIAPCQELEKEGFEVTYLPVGRDGILDPIQVKKHLRPDTILVSIMYANNEIGTIQPIAEIAKVIRNFRNSKHEARNSKKFGFRNSDFEFNEKTPFFHSDACQAAGALDLDVEKLGVDLMTISGSKIYGPKGIGFLYIRSGTRIKPIIFGGGQERGMRSGTENIPGIVGLATALELAEKNRIKESKRLTALRDYLIAQIKRKFPNSILNGHPSRRLPNNVNFSFVEFIGEEIQAELDKKGICVSLGSACAAGKHENSHVILALGRKSQEAHGTIRITLGKSTTKDDLKFLLTNLEDVLNP